MRRTVASASLAAPPQVDLMEIAGVSPETVAVPELGVAPRTNTDTELEDELPMPEDSPLFCNSSPEEARPLRVRPAIRELVDLELEKALLCVSILPEMVGNASPACSVYEPATSPVTPYLQEYTAYQPPPSPATMDQYLYRDGVLLLGDVMALPGLSSPLSPVPVVDIV